MFSKALMHIWDRKLEIARLDRDTKLRQLAHEQAHNAAMTSIPNATLQSGGTAEYRSLYVVEFISACDLLGVQTGFPKEVA